jgi:CheY-like chemotaxis protein
MGLNVIVVEDDVHIQNTLKFAIELEGYTVFLANNGKEALQLASSVQDACVILLDLMMPEMDGFEFLAVRKADPTLAKIPVLVISAFHDKARNLDAQGFIKKPVNLDDLFSLIKKHCA